MSKTAIVLAGGGSRGAYQLGVWKALREMGVDYQLVTGTSVGALNGTLMVQQDYEKACQVWENITSEDIVGDMLAEKGDLNDHQLNRIFAREALEKGGADISYLEKFVYSLLDEEKFWNSEIDFALVTVEYPSLKPLELKKKIFQKECWENICWHPQPASLLSDKGNQWTAIYRWRIPRQYAGESGNRDGRG